MGNRRRSRELALQTLYALDRKKVQGDTDMVEEAISHMKIWAQEGTEDREEEKVPADPQIETDVESFAETLIRGVIEKVTDLDNVIGSAAVSAGVGGLCSPFWGGATVAPAAGTGTLAMAPAGFASTAGAAPSLSARAFARDASMMTWQRFVLLLSDSSRQSRRALM